jgi:hypothetical protein
MTSTLVRERTGTGTGKVVKVEEEEEEEEEVVPPLKKCVCSFKEARSSLF